MSDSLSRRGFLCGLPGAAFAADDIPRVDFHAHLDDRLPREQAIAGALESSRIMGVKFGILEHAGGREGPHSKRMSSDAELDRWFGMLEGKPCFKGIQAEGLDWMKYFSRQAVARLDYVLSDALTFPEKNGRRVQLWKAGVEIGAADAQDFMDRYTEFHVQVMAAEPIDIIANTTFLPECLKPNFDALWTPSRMRRIVDASIRYGVAIEINSKYSVPHLPFLRMAKQAGARFSIGSNAHGTGAGKIGYCLRAAKAAGLSRSDFFTPAAAGKKPIQLRRFS